MRTCLGVKGRLMWRHMRGKIILAEGVIPNQVKDEGIDEALTILFSAANLATWYMGLIDNAGFGAPLTTDTYTNLKLATLAWDELNANNYINNSNTLRLPIVWGSPVGGLVDSADNPTVFEVSSNGNGKTINGIFLTNQEDFTSGVGWMWSTVILPAPRALATGDQFIVGYEVSLGRV